MESIQNEKNIVTQDSNSNRCRFMNKWYKVFSIRISSFFICKNNNLYIQKNKENKRRIIK